MRPRPTTSARSRKKSRKGCERPAGTVYTIHGINGLCKSSASKVPQKRLYRTKYRRRSHSFGASVASAPSDKQLYSESIANSTRRSINSYTSTTASSANSGGTNSSRHSTKICNLTLLAPEPLLPQESSENLIPNGEPTTESAQKGWWYRFSGLLNWPCLLKFKQKFKIALRKLNLNPLRWIARGYRWAYSQSWHIGYRLYHTMQRKRWRWTRPEAY